LYTHTCASHSCLFTLSVILLTVRIAGPWARAQGPSARAQEFRAWLDIGLGPEPMSWAQSSGPGLWARELPGSLNLRAQGSGPRTWPLWTLGLGLRALALGPGQCPMCRAQGPGSNVHPTCIQPAFPGPGPLGPDLAHSLGPGPGPGPWARGPWPLCDIQTNIR
jgi:hypothetical protein